MIHPSRRARLMAAVRAAAAMLFLPGAAQALDPAKAVTQYHRQVWRSDEGLPQNSALALAQTPDGYLWIGTEEGLARFDGVRFQVFDPGNTPELRHRVVRALAVDAKGALWIGTMGGGVVRFAGGRFRAYGRAEGLPDERVRVVYADRQDRLWAGTSQGLSLFEGGRFVSLGQKEGVPALPVRALLQTRDGALWIGTRGHGLLRWKDAAVTAYTTKDGLPHDTVIALSEDATGRLWVGTAEGLARLEGGRIVREDLGAGPAASQVSVITSDQGGNVWIGSRAGLHRFRDGRWEPSRGPSVSQDAVVSIYEDREGALWVGSMAGGLSQLRDGRFTVYSTLEGLSDDYVWTVYEDREGGLWLGTQSGGLNHIRAGSVRAYRRKDGLASDTILTIVRDRRGDVWAGTPRGLNRIRGGRISVLTKEDGLSDDYINAVLEDRRGDVWAATAAGLNRIRGRRVESFTTRDGLSSNDLSRLLEGRDGSLWIGTVDAGLNRLADGRFTHYGTREGLGSRYVTSLYEDDEGALWIGGAGGGLSRLQDGRITVYTSRDGLPTDTIFQIVDDGRGSFWLSSNKGLFRVRRQDLQDHAEGRLQRLTSTAYGKADGMRSAECNGGTQPAGLRSRDGRLWFPTIRGAVVVDLGRLEAKSLPPPVVIEEMRVDNRPLPLAGGLVLPPGSGLIELHYTGLSLAAVETLRFRYRLEGFEESWQDAGPRRTAYYTKLPPGSYRFRVAASSRDGAWNEAGTPLEFRIRPRFYQTAWFFALGGTAVAFLAFGFHRFQVTLVEARAAVFEERNRIAQEVHDGVAQGVGGIAMQLEAARSAADPNLHLERARTLADQTLEELRCSISALRPALLHGASLPEALERLVEPLTAGTGAQIRVEVDGAESELPAALEADLLRIAQEALFNATRHGRARHVAVRLTYHRRSVELEILDDGHGFDPSRTGAEDGLGFGLPSMRRRAERLGGRLVTRSEPGQGAQVTAVFPTRGRVLAALRSAGRRLALLGAPHVRSAADTHPPGGRPSGHP